MSNIARCCGGSGTCACKVVQGRKVAVTGTGSSQDPFVIASDVDLSVEDSLTFDLGLAGDGTLASPWILRVAFAPTAQLSGSMDVSDHVPTNGQVLGWNAAEQKWLPTAPAIATPGGVNSNTSLNGDGSIGDPLGVRADTTRFLSVTTAGVGLNNAGINQLVRVFSDATARASASPVPVTNSISLLNSEPGQIDYYDGAQWLPVTNGIGLDIKPGQMLALSGPYAGGPVTQYVAQLDDVTDADGVFEVISADDLIDYAGVLAVSLTRTGDVAWQATFNADVNRIIATANRVDDGTPYAASPVTGTVTALLY